MSILLSFLPLVKSNLVSSNNIIIDSKSGYSGAGKNLKKKFNHKNIYSSIHAYGILKHRHTSEIDQEFKKISKSEVNYIFVPNLIPTFRGMLSSIYLELSKGITANKVYNELKKYHRNNFFVRIQPLNKDLGTENVLNTNFCEISICTLKEKGKILILSAIDNLVKGAAGQAVQNFNILYGFKENLGLKWNFFSFYFFFLLVELDSIMRKQKKYIFVGTMNVKAKKKSEIILITIFLLKYTQ